MPPMKTTTAATTAQSIRDSPKTNCTAAGDSTIQQQARACGSLRAPNRLPRSPCGHHPDIADENPLIGAVGVDHPNFGGSASVGVEQQLRAVRRPNGIVVRCRSRRSGELRLVAAVLVHDPDLAVGVLDPRPIGNPLAVQPRRSVGAAALGRVVIFLGKRQLFLLISVAVHDPELAKPFLVARPESDPV